MIKPHPALARFERQYAGDRKLSYKQALRIFEGLWIEARSLGSIDPSRPLDGIEVDIEIAQTLNRLPGNPKLDIG
jgi:hypothetical protein